MAPTTLLGMRSTTSPHGRTLAEGAPIRVCELLASLTAPAYLERVALNSPRNIRKAKAAIRKGFVTQIEGRGFSLVECLSPCPTYWRKPPADAMKFVGEEMVKTFPLGVFRDWEKEAHAE